jgi:hypothetical protein
MSTSTETNGTPDLAAECKKWENLCGEMLAERLKLREELARTQTERDSYRKTVLDFMRKDLSPPPYTKEQMLAFVGQAEPFDEFIAEIGREYGGEP